MHFILPILVGIMTAKWTADALEHALYHSLLEFKNVPFLPSEPPGGQALEIMPVRARPPLGGPPAHDPPFHLHC